MIVGDKQNFAIEFTKLASNQEMGYGKIWIQNEFFGTNQDLIYFQGSLISLLDEIMNSNTVKFEFKELTKLEVFEYFENHPNRFEYLIRGSTFTDDFTAYSFEANGRIHLIWKMWNDENILFSDLKDYGTEIKFRSVDKIRIENTRKQLLKKTSYCN